MAGCLTGSRTQYADVQALLPKFREYGGLKRAAIPASVPITIWGAKESLGLLKRDRDDGVSRRVAHASIPPNPIRSCRELDRWATFDSCLARARRVGD